MADLLRRLAARGIVSLLAEGGGEIHAALLEAGLVDRLALFVAPVIVGGKDAVAFVGGKGVETMAEAHQVSSLSVRRFGRDLLLEGAVVSKPSERTSSRKRP